MNLAFLSMVSVLFIRSLVCIVFGVHCLCESVEEPKILCLDSECAG